MHKHTPVHLQVTVGLITSIALVMVVALTARSLGGIGASVTGQAKPIGSPLVIVDTETQGGLQNTLPDHFKDAIIEETTLIEETTTERVYLTKTNKGYLTIKLKKDGELWKVQTMEAMRE